MAFTPLTLFRLGGAPGAGPGGGPSAWLYSTLDAMTTVDNTDYFQACKFRGMAVGDPVLVSKTDGPNLYVTFVSAIDSDGNVTVSGGTTIS